MVTLLGQTPAFRGDFKIILQASKIADPDLKGVPHVYSYARTDDDRKVFDLIFRIQQLGRMFVATTGMEVVKTPAVRKAFNAAMKDPKLITQVKKPTSI